MMTETMIVDLDGYEGPLDVLLTLAREQKLDLAQISILQLAEQYLDFIRQARDLQIEVAADYLVMASWLAFLKSRLLLPRQEEDPEDPATLADNLRFQLQRLAAMREAGEALLERNQLGRDIFPRGMPEGIRIKRHSLYDATLYEMLTAYSTQRLRAHYTHWQPPDMPVVTLARARQRLEKMLGAIKEWDAFDKVVLSRVKNKQERRTMLASSFSALLELVYGGQAEVRQNENFGQIYIKNNPVKSVKERL